MSEGAQKKYQNTFSRYLRLDLLVENKTTAVLMNRVSSSSNKIIDLCLRYISFDPNYNYDDNNGDDYDDDDENSMEHDNINSDK